VLGEGHSYFSDSQLDCCEVSNVDRYNGGDDNRSASHYTPASFFSLSLSRSVSRSIITHKATNKATGVLTQEPRASPDGSFPSS
jgi:hypothetical protein